MKIALPALAALLVTAPTAQAQTPVACPPPAARIQVSITEVVVSNHHRPGISGSTKDYGKPRHDLDDLTAALKASHTVYTVTPGFNITTTDGVPGTMSIITKLPLSSPGQSLKTVEVGKTTRVLPRVLPDGHVSAQITYTDTEPLYAAPGDANPTRTTTQTLTSTQTFRSGGTQLLGG